MDMLKYKIADITLISASVKLFTLAPLDRKLEFKPGQFTMLHLLDNNGQSVDKRPYSIASSPLSKHLELCIKILPEGRFTQKLDTLKKGTTIGVEGAWGNFHYHEETNAVFLAGGTGVAPFLSVLRYLNEKKINGNFALFYSVRAREFILYRKELEQLSKNPNFKIVITLTREEPKAWKGECGRITTAMLKKHVPQLAALGSVYFYICGPMEMAMSIHESITSSGVKKEKVFFEGWG
jgi:NAD(P)H-flavin reductase